MFKSDSLTQSIKKNKNVVITEIEEGEQFGYIHLFNKAKKFGFI